MRKHKKILFALITLSGIFLCLLLILVVVTPRLVNLDTVKEKIKSQYANDTGGRIEYQHVDLALFPRPHVVISDVHFTLPDKVDGTLASLDVYPKILPLFTGELQIGMLRSRSPEINIRFPETLDGKTGDSGAASFETHGAQLVAMIRSLPEFKIPAIVLHIRNGRANFFEGQNRILGLQSINGSVKRKTNRFEFALNCQSNFWESMDINGRYEEPGFKINSRITITQLRPHAVVDYFLPQSDLKIMNARANLTLDLQTDGPEDLQATIDGSIPFLNLRKGKKELKLADTSFQGGYQLKNKKLILSVSQLNLKDPRLTLAGQLVADPASPDIQLEIEGRQIDVQTTRRIALALTEDVDAVNEVFEIMRSGEFERVTLRTRGPTLADLAGGDNYVIQGNMVGGNIYIPGVELNLEDVSGDAKIRNGVLEGENVQARMRNSYGKKGKLAIALTEDTAPFHIEGLIQADLSELPAVLLRVIDDDKLKKELALFDKVSGSAVGMLLIGEDTKDLNVRVMASDIRLEADYRRIPFPLKIDGGSLHLDGDRIGLTDINAAVGKSSLSRLSAKFRWEQGSAFEIASKSAGIDLAEVYTWLSQEKRFQQDLKNINALSGMVSLTDFDLKGPFSKPDQWWVTSNGDVRALSMSSALLPGQLTVEKGQFTFEGNHFSIKNVAAIVGKSSVAALSADLKWDRQVMLTANSGRTAIFLDEVYPWLQSHEDLRPKLKDIPALTGILAFQNLAFAGPISGKTNQDLSLTGTIETLNLSSPDLPTSIILSGGELAWQGNRFDLRDSNARLGESTITRLAFGMQWGKVPASAVRADSAGILIAELYPWLVSFKALEEAFKGFRATQGRLVLSGLDIKGPQGRSGAWRFHLTGEVTGMVIESDYFKAPINIHSAKFAVDDTTGAEGIQGQLNLADMQMGWEDSRITAKGDLAFSENELNLDLNLAADQINWGQIEQIVEIEGKPESDSTVALLGELRIESGSLTIGSYTWRPVRADISFNKTDTSIVIKKATLCGIESPGMLKVSSNEFEFYLTPVASDQNLGPTVTCLTDKENLADGSFDLTGELMAKARPADLLKSLSGNLEFNAAQGRIYRFGLLAKIFALLNVTEIYRGEVPDLGGEGFAYDSMSANAVFEDGKLIIKESTIDSPSMGIASEGKINLIEKKMNLTVLVAPFKTVDRIVRNIPVVSHILGGKLVSIPFRAIGKLDDPAVIPLEPTAVGSNLLGILGRTLKLPITAIQLVLPDSKEHKDKKKNQEAAQ